MLDYEMFKEVAKDELRTYLPGKLNKMDVVETSVKKVNQELDGISLVDEGSTKMISPTIYLNDLYEDYKKSGDIEEVMMDAANLFARGMDDIEKMQPDLSISSAPDNIVFSLVNTEQNRDMLSNAPHREFQDLSIVYRWIVGYGADGSIRSTMVQNDLAERMGLSEKELYNLAVENTRRLLPPKVMSMQEMMRKVLVSDGMPDEMVDMLTTEMEPEQTMWIISNDRGINGAVNMLYEDQLKEISEKLGNDLYVLPSSVHEVIAISTAMAEPEELAEMVRSVNLSSVEIGERLSNQVYHYDKDLRKLTLATDTPNKRLDGKVAEPQLIYETKGQSR